MRTVVLELARYLRDVRSPSSPTSIAYPAPTSRELAEGCGLDRHEAAKRLADAQEMGLVAKIEPPRLCRSSGRRAYTWQLTADGRALAARAGVEVAA